MEKSSVSKKATGNQASNVSAMARQAKHSKMAGQIESQLLDAMERLRQAESGLKSYELALKNLYDIGAALPPLLAAKIGAKESDAEMLHLFTLDPYHFFRLTTDCHFLAMSRAKGMIQAARALAV